MGGKKVELVRIADESARKQSMTRRQKGIMKKVDELTTLCGVPAVCIINSPAVPGAAPKPPLVWPSNDDEQVRQLIQRYYSIPEAERGKKKTDQETYLEEMIAKTELKHSKLKKKNENREAELLMDEVHFGKGLNGMDMNELDTIKRLLTQRLNVLSTKRGGQPQQPAAQAPGDGPQCSPNLPIRFGVGNQPVEMGVADMDVDPTGPINTHNVFPDPQLFSSAYEMGQGSGSGGIVDNGDLSIMFVNAREVANSHGNNFSTPSAPAAERTSELAQVPTTRVDGEGDDLNLNCLRSVESRQQKPQL